MVTALKRSSYSIQLLMLINTGFGIQSMRQDKNVKIIQVANPRVVRNAENVRHLFSAWSYVLRKLFYEAFWKYFHKSSCKRFMEVTNCWSLNSEQLF